MKLATITGITILGFAFLALGAGALSASPAGTARASGYRIVLASTRDGATRAYSARPDGSHLTPLLRPTRALEPLDVSGNGRTVLYTDHRYPNTIYVSRADGTGLRRVARGNKKSGIDCSELAGWAAGTRPGRRVLRLAQMVSGRPLDRIRAWLGNHEPLGRRPERQAPPSCRPLTGRLGAPVRVVA